MKPFKSVGAWLVDLVARSMVTRPATRRGKAEQRPFVNISRPTRSRQRLSKKNRTLFYEHLRDQVGNDIALETALGHFRARMVRAKNHRAAQQIALLISQLRNGKKFSEALQDLVSLEDIAIIRAGEISGKLPFVLGLLLEQHAKAQRLKQALREGLLGTFFYFFAACILIGYLAREVIPQLISTVPPEKAHGTVKMLYSVAGFMNSYAIFVVILVVVGMIALIAWSFTRWTGRSRVLAERYFPYSYYRDLMGYQWLMVFATLLSSGIADVEILKMQSLGASPYLRERLSLLYQRLRGGGMSLGQALITPPGKTWPPMDFPSPDINESIIALYGFANFPERITKLVSQWADQIETRTLALAKLISNGLAFAMMLAIALLILAMQELTNQVGSSV